MEIFPVDVLYRTWTNTEGQARIDDIYVLANIASH